jgi:hypothetical protein
VPAEAPNEATLNKQKELDEAYGQLWEDYRKGTADLRAALEHDEKIDEWIDVVMENMAAYIERVKKSPKPESVALAQEALADNEQRLVSRTLEMRDKQSVARRLDSLEKDLGTARKKLKEARAVADKAAAEQAAAKAAGEAAKNEVEAIEKAFKAPKQDQEFDDQCKPDIWAYVIDPKTRIDFLGLKSLLDNLYDREDRIYRGIPDVSLSQLLLTSEFNLSLEVSAGMNYFRFIPILAAPGADLKAEHTHLLKVTLNGKKTKNAPGNNTGSKNLIASCEQRVNGGTATSDNYCASAEGQLLENILLAVSISPPSPSQ